MAIGGGMQRSQQCLREEVMTIGLHGGVSHAVLGDAINGGSDRQQDNIGLGRAISELYPTF